MFGEKYLAILKGAKPYRIVIFFTEMLQHKQDLTKLQRVFEVRAKTNKYI
jgi:hypothetical protein